MTTALPRSILSPLVAILVGAIALALCLPAAAETTLERVQRTGEIRIGYANETPFAYTQIDGKVTGESPEIANIIFAQIGCRCQAQRPN